METAKQWNSSRPSAEQWEPSLYVSILHPFALNSPNEYNSSSLEDMASRFEIPNPRNRWDKPLWTVKQDQSLPLQDISSYLYEIAEQPMQRNVATEYVRCKVCVFTS